MRIKREQLDYNFLDELLGVLPQWSFNKDSNKKFENFRITRLDGTKFIDSVASNPDAKGNYQTITITEYQKDGIKTNRTIKLTVAYDNDDFAYKVDIEVI